MKIHVFYKIIISALLLSSTASFAIDPPVITATGNQIYCLGTSIKIVETISIKPDPAEPQTDALYVQISSGYVFGQDVLTLSNATAHPKIITSWDSVAGKLKLSSPTGAKIPYTDFEAAIKDIVFSNSSLNPSGTRNFSITIGQANFLPSTGHYYEYVPNIGIWWTSAKTAAEARNYYGLKGYLATISSLEEVQITGEQAKGAGWIGGSDAATENVWKWVTGPEGLANGGTGITFWNGLANGTSPNFAYWNDTEPNQFNGTNEDYAHITAPGVGIPGSWNDLTITGNPTGDYQPKGYIVEYGGMPGDPILQISASTTITIPKIISTTPASVCGSGVVTLQASATTNGTVSWYTSNTGGSPIATGNSFTTPTIYTSTSYYVDARNGSCPNEPRTAIIATVNISPSITSTTSGNRCDSGIVTLGATASAGTINWYDAQTGGNLLGTGTSFTTPTITTTTTYYVDATASGCTTLTRTAIIATVNITPSITSTTSGNRCDSGTVTLGATASAGTINWYDAQTGGNLLGTGTTFTTPTITTTTTYYVDATASGCTTPTRTAIIATVNISPSITSTTAGNLCDSGTVTLLATSLTGIINWYDAQTGGNLLATGTTKFTTPNITTTTTYYVDATASGCITPTRTAIIATVNISPSITSTTSGNRCDSGTIILGAAASGGTINWYDAQTGGNLLGTGTTFTTPTITTTTTYYVDATASGCTTLTRTAIIATVNISPSIISTITGNRCDSGTVTLGATASAGTINWYDAQTGGNLLGTGITFTTPTITTTTTYYVDATNGSCTTTARTEIIATINTLPNPPQIAVSSTSPVLYCLNATATPLVAIASADCILNWYALPTGGTGSVNSPLPNTSVAGSTTYYVSQSNTTNGCESTRVAIIVTVNPLPAAPIVNNVNYCNNETSVPLAASATPNCTLNWYVTNIGGTSSLIPPVPSTATVGSTKYYVSQTIIATGCEGPKAEIIVTVNPLPTAPIVTNIGYCHNEIAIPLTATASANCILNWYTNATGGTSSATSPTPSTATLGTTKYFVSQTTTATRCEGPRSEIIVTINPLPIVKDVTIVQCDSDLIADGKTLFNLTVNNYAISTNYSNETFTYYTSFSGANNAIAADLISNELSFENTTPTLMPIWTRVTNKITGCHRVAKITLKVPATNINPNYKIPYSPVCDDFLDINGNNNINNNKRDGITTFDFSSTTAILLAQLPTSQAYSINYYKNQSDALAELNAIATISNYRNIGYPNSQDIWIRIDSDLDNACYGLGPYLTLNVEALPVANTVTITRQCDDNNDGIFSFNTSSLESNLLKGQNNVLVTYYDLANNPLKDANGVSIISPFPANFTSTSQTIKAIVTNNTPQQCFDETTITFTVDDSPIATAVPSALTTACDDEANPINQDGIVAFDTSTFETIILGGQIGMDVKYYDQNNVLLSSPLPNPFVTNTQNITVKVQNPLNSICTASTTLRFVVNPIPKIDLNEDGLSNMLVCSNLSTFFVTLDAGILDSSPTSDYDYIWTKNGVITGSNFPTLDVNTVGDYAVEVINNFGCSSIRPITVTASNIATIVSIDVIDLSDVNTVTVNVTGPGDYEYSLDEPNGFWQDSNFFDNVPAGEHVVYINDKNGCGQVYQEIAILGVPKFFTPNGDSYNDVWEIKGVSKYPQAEIQLFDRYGKNITTLNAINKNWNGNYNGAPLPADDYWFVMNLGNGKPEIKGHFSLKR